MKKLCKNCKHFGDDWMDGYNKCRATYEISPIDGSKHYHSARFHRDDDWLSSRLFGTRGMEGRFFELKEKKD